MQEPRGHDDVLTAALRAVAEDDARLGASMAVERQLLAEVQSMARVRRRRTRTTVALAAVLTIAVAVPIWRVAHRSHVDRAPVRLDRPARPSSDDMTAAFFPLGYSTVPVTGAQVVRLEVPRAALTSFGVAPADTVNGSSAGTVLADVLVGEDGLARAVRFVSNTHQAQRP